LSTRLYSTGLLEEAHKLSLKVGVAQASVIAGVNKHSLSHYIQAHKLANGHTPKPYNGSNALPPAKKRACVILAFQLFKKGFSRSMRNCWIQAGKRTGVNGRSVEFQYVRGLWKP
jgi:hypothetical protein